MFLRSSILNAHSKRSLPSIFHPWMDLKCYGDIALRFLISPFPYNQCKIRNHHCNQRRTGMDVKTRYTGLDELLSIIYGQGEGLSTLLGELGFEQVRVEQL